MKYWVRASAHIQYENGASVLYKRGESFESDSDLAHLVGLGALSTEPPAPAAPAAPVTVDEVAAPPAAPVATVLPRPRNTASTDEWRAYAESLGIDTKGLKTREVLRAAVAKIAKQ